MPGLRPPSFIPDRRGGIEHGSLQKPVHATVAYGYEDVQDLADVFQGRSSAYSYGRQVNPTVTALETKINAMEGGVATVCFATGMAAIGTVLFTLLQQGDHFVSSSFLFGNTNSLFRSFGLHGLDVTFVDATRASAVEQALRSRDPPRIRRNHRQPTVRRSPISRASARSAADGGLVYVVDNTMTSPYLFQPVDVRRLARSSTA